MLDGAGIDRGSLMAAARPSPHTWPKFVDALGDLSAYRVLPTSAVDGLVTKQGRGGHP